MSDKLQEPLIKYREAVPTSSPGLPPRLPWVTNSIRLLLGNTEAAQGISLDDMIRHQNVITDNHQERS